MQLFEYEDVSHNAKSIYHDYSEIKYEYIRFNFPILVKLKNWKCVNMFCCVDEVAPKLGTLHVFQSNVQFRTLRCCLNIDLETLLPFLIKNPTLTEEGSTYILIYELLDMNYMEAKSAVQI